MAQITLRLGEDLLDELDEEADEHGVSRSEHIRNTLASRHEHDPDTDELQRVREEHAEEVAELETTIERLRNEKSTILEQRKEHRELVRATESRETRADRLSKAGAWTRLKWWATGMPDEE